MANGIDDSRDVAVIIPAAGIGSRIGGVPKQFRRLGHETLLRRTVSRFVNLKEVRQIVVVVPGSRMSEAKADLEPIGPDDLDGLVLTPGGATRQQSVRMGLKRLCPEARVVLVHDAARPFVTTDKIREVVAAVRDHAAASLAVPVADTLRKVVGMSFDETVSREGVFRMQTPQGFRRTLLVAAHREAVEKGWQTTDDVDLVMRQGHPVRLVSGSTINFKITTHEDWELAERMVRDVATIRENDG